MEVLFMAISTAVTMGLGCGSCCSPFISIFLSSYIVSHGNGMKTGILSFLGFLFGKVFSITVILILCAMLGRQFLSQDGYIGFVNMQVIGQVFMSFIGIILLIRWGIEHKRIYHLKAQNHCKTCKYNCGNEEKKESAHFLPMVFAGISYGITPCTPLLIMAGYSATLPIPAAGIAGIFFGSASLFGTGSLLALCSGALSKKLFKELPEMLQCFRVLSYGIMIVLPFVIGIGD